MNNQEKEVYEQKLKTMDEEMTYLKRHYEMELGLLKDENEILKRELHSLSMTPPPLQNAPHFNMSLTPN